MTTRPGVAEPSAAGRLEPVLGGAPLPAACPYRPAREAGRQAAETGSETRRDAERPPESYERFRILSELVDQGRQVIELADHRARYALVVMSVLNAFVFLVISRSHLLGELPATFRTWLISFIGLYGVLTFIFVFYAVDCLRPRSLRYAEALGDRRSGRQGPLGILYWEGIAGYDLEGFRRAWSEARMEQLNAEVVIFASSLARVVRAAYLDLGRLSGLWLGLSYWLACCWSRSRMRAHGLRRRDLSRRR